MLYTKYIQYTCDSPSTWFRTLFRLLTILSPAVLHRSFLTRLLKTTWKQNMNTPCVEFRAAKMTPNTYVATDPGPQNVSGVQWVTHNTGWILRCTSTAVNPTEWETNEKEICLVHHYWRTWSQRPTWGPAGTTGWQTPSAMWCTASCSGAAGLACGPGPCWGRGTGIQS